MPRLVVFWRRSFPQGNLHAERCHGAPVGEESTFLDTVDPVHRPLTPANQNSTTVSKKIRSYLEGNIFRSGNVPQFEFCRIVRACKVDCWIRHKRRMLLFLHHAASIMRLTKCCTTSAVLKVVMKNSRAFAKAAVQTVKLPVGDGI